MTIVKLEHFAESVVAFFFERLSLDADFRSFLEKEKDKYFYYNYASLDEKIPLHNMYNFFENFDGNVKTNDTLGALNVGGMKLIFDGSHNIDVSIQISNKIFPIEVKSGMSGKSKSFPDTFFDYFSRTDKPETSHEGKRYKGNIINLLENLSNWNGDLKTKEDREVLKKWGLVVNGNNISPSNSLNLDGHFKNLEFIVGLNVILKSLKDSKLIEDYKKEFILSFDDISQKTINANYEK